MSDDNETGGPVEKLEFSAPLNKILTAYQMAFNESYGKLLAWLDGQLRTALAEKFHGWLDVKISLEPHKVQVRAHRRAKNKPAPRGSWWTLPLTPTVLEEFFERIKGEPADPEKAAPVDVDASQPMEQKAPTPADLMRARARECRALLGNLQRSADEVKERGGSTYSLFGAINSLERIESELLDAAAAHDGETLQ